MEESMNNMLIVGIVLGAFQFVLILLMGLIGYIFKSSMSNLQASINEIKDQRKLDEKNKREDFDEVFVRLRSVEVDVVGLKGRMREAV